MPEIGIHPSKKNLLFFGLIRDYKGIRPADRSDGTSLTRITISLWPGECCGSFEKYQALIDASPAKERIFVHCEYISDEKSHLFLSGRCAVSPYRSATQSGVVSALQLRFTYVEKLLPVVISRTASKPGTGIVVPEISAGPRPRYRGTFHPLTASHHPCEHIQRKSSSLVGNLTRKLLDFINSGFI